MSQKQKAKNKDDAKNSKVQWTAIAWSQYLEWFDGDNNKWVPAIHELINECLRTPFTGTGKPEPLRGSLSGFWSRRITKEHRLVYLYENDTLYIVSCRYHY